MTRAQVRHSIRRVLRSKPLSGLTDFLQHERQKLHARIASTASAKLKPQVGTHVLRGPFQGMVVPLDVGRPIQRLLGSYEAELHDIIEEVCKRRYEVVIDVGCAGGHYAVGLAMRMPEATVYGFDIDAEALRACGLLATANDVRDRLTLEGACDVDRLRHFDFNKRTLLFSDCEGYELELLRPDLVPGLTRCDLIIEMHDNLNPRISQVLQERFAATHDIKTVRTKSRSTGDFPELHQLGWLERQAVLSEMRPSMMEWAYMTSKDLQRDGSP